MKIYNEQGYLYVDDIAKHNSWLKVLIGARQIGKTYNVLKYHLDNNIPFIFLRRTTEELNLIGGSAELNPFKPFEPEYKIGLFKTGKYWTVNHYTEEGKSEAVGLALSLAQIAHIRGFNGSNYASIIYDEFIPEKSVVTRKTEGDALLNAYTTINGNRELNGAPPCTLWLLANSNNINSPVLEAFELTDDVIKARAKGIEIYYDEGAIIVQPRSRAVLDKRKDTALMKRVNKKSTFYGMAIENDFSYDRSPLVQNLSIKHMTPLFSYGGFLYAWENDTGVYICRAYHNKDAYTSDSWSVEKMRSNYLWLIRYYAEGLVLFSDLHMITMFKQVFSISF